jgi:hypothetical protein
MSGGFKLPGVVHSKKRGAVIVRRDSQLANYRNAEAGTRKIVPAFFIFRQRI